MPDKTPFDPYQRFDAIQRRLLSLSPDEARREVIGLVGGYHLLENEILKPKEGFFMTDYFYLRWRPTLGDPAWQIVVALQRLADRKSQSCIASYQKIADRAGVGVATVKRWLGPSTSAYWNSQASDKQNQQYQYLHRYFILSKHRRKRETKDGRRYTTNLFKIALDDPIHPDDESQLFVLAAYRAVNQEYLEATGKAFKIEGLDTEYQPDTKAPNPIEISPQVSPTGDHRDTPLVVSGRYHSSLSNVINDLTLKETTKAKSYTESAFSQDPRVLALTGHEQERNERLIWEVGAWLQRKERRDESEPHKSQGFHRRAVYFMGEDLIRQAMRDLEDRIADGREGRKDPVRNISATFGGFIGRICRQNDISLEPQPETSHSQN